MSAGQQLAHRIPLLAVKAGFSALPLAVFAFDVIREVVDFGNAQLTDRFLENVATRIDRLEESERERERLKADTIYQMSGRSALQRLLTETNPRMADALARAVAELGASKLPDGERLEIARTLDVLTEPSLHLLQTLYRVWNDKLTLAEIAAGGGDPRQPHRLTAMLGYSMPALSWIPAASGLQRAGLIEAVVGADVFAEAQELARADEGRTMPLYRVYALGERVLRLCLDEPDAPNFGNFAI